MLENVPFSAYLICYGPLAVTVLGFIAFALLTDWDSRRTYLRRLDPRTERELDSEELPPVSRTIIAETPANVPVQIMPEEGDAAGKVLVSDSAPAVEAPTAAPAVEAPTGELDDLKKIEGIGPKISAALVDGGIDTFVKLAEATQEELIAVLEAAGIRFTPSMETWQEQAAMAARGDWDALQAFQDNLTAGRRS